MNFALYLDPPLFLNARNPGYIDVEYDVTIFIIVHYNSFSGRSLAINEVEKKRKYNERVMQIEHGTFTPLVFSATGGMGREASKVFQINIK